MVLTRRLRLTRSCATSPGIHLSDKSFLMLSNHLRFGLPLPLFPGTSITVTLSPTYSYSHFNTCPHHFNILSCTFFYNSPTFVVPLNRSCLILYSLVTLLIHLNILISAISNFFSFAFLHCPCLGTVHHYWPNNRLVYFRLILKLITRSHRTPDTFFQLFHPDCMIRVISTSKSQLSANVAPIYLNVITLSKFCLGRLMSEFSSKFPSP